MNLLGPPIEFPEVPCVVSIPGGVRVGLLIRIQGEVHRRASRFSINIATGSQISYPMSDMGFHFNPRFDDGYVARNSLIDGEWGKEEYEEPNQVPFTKGRPFEVMLLVEGFHYKVAVDGVHFLQYSHRLFPLERLNTLQILGDVRISKLEFLDSNPIPQLAYGFQPTIAEPMRAREIFDPIIPFVTGIPGGIYVGLVIKIHGRSTEHAKEFKINIANGPHMHSPRSDIAFHFNPRFDCGYVARNTLVDEMWGEEENEYPSHLPFHRKERFEISICVENFHYKVNVNGSHFLNYKHRVPFERFDTLEILGDVKVSKIEFINPNQPQSFGFQPPPMNIPKPIEILNPAVPFRQVIPGGMPVGKSIFITGRPKPYATR
ncbi:Lectin, galactoside-binding, soluble [Chamberlinius hualienensis]